jgi:hypothetical protein
LTFWAKLEKDTCRLRRENRNLFVGHRNILAAIQNEDYGKAYTYLRITEEKNGPVSPANGMQAYTIEQTIFHINLLRRLENLGVECINSPAAIEKCLELPAYLRWAILEGALCNFFNKDVR